MGNSGGAGRRPSVSREDTGETSFDDDSQGTRGAPSFAALQRDVTHAQRRCRSSTD
jgi:hypothetical protein